MGSQRLQQDSLARNVASLYEPDVFILKKCFSVKWSLIANKLAYC